ncbi:U4/U6 small nuclear ribonucleoprotein PRP4 [Babesia microti strain RI]|uniref:U4/U6 small nuclear ribonucleoprotein PRP4 n=1 Tax=Babesia microti (strain RI) TaxID=1133968 RepID=I7JAX0_BABMR|nr:U4/U6 small nuclear ribonucleoprotein PRP4 [Babesia microti strain RI]CCF73979.1 U4/U6 small nuclear ribonucleoprotein PRP4 [Babesia microti strain RI]|eukprot:XP_012648588.1 U4/U6 small nuclear ribonucleoprotein PRP4 [Babesia microti strain RI]
MTDLTIPISSKALKEFELRSRLSSVTIAVPTLDNSIRWILRSLKEPIHLFGEGKFERRERTKSLILFKYDKYFKDGHMVEQVIELHPEAKVLHEIVQKFQIDMSSVYSKRLKAQEETKAKKTLDPAQTKREYQAQLEKLKRKQSSKVFYTEPENPEDVKNLRLQIVKHSFESWRDLKLQLGSYKQDVDIYEHEKRIGNYIDHLTNNVELIASQIGSDRPLTRAKFSPDGQSIITSSYSNDVRLYTKNTSQDADNCREDYIHTTGFSAGHTDRVLDIVWSPSGILSACADGSLSHTSISDFDVYQTISVHESRINSVVLHPIKSFFITASSDETLCYIDLEKMQPIYVQEGHGYPVHSVNVNRYGSLCASGDSKGAMLIFDLRTGRHIFQDQIHHQIVTGVSFHPINCHIFATSSADNTVKIHDLRKMQAIKTLLAHLKVVSSLQFESDGRFLATSSFDGTVKLWDCVGYKCFKILETAGSRVVDVTMNNEFILSASYDRIFRLYNL